jgi:hypothetical protein
MFQWPLSKIDICNSALSQTGDNLVASSDDGSDEWNVASPAYERALAYIMEGHSWGFATDVRTLVASPTAPTDTAWDTAYPFPADMVHLIWVRINQSTVAQNVGQPCLYDIQAGQLVVNAQGGPPPPPTPVVPAIITIKAVFQTYSDPTFGTPTFVLALQTFVMSGIYRGLHEDPQEADKMFQAAEMILQQARTRYDQQKPKRSFFNSRIGAVRRVRKPWPQTGNDNWGGTGQPS